MSSLTTQTGPLTVTHVVKGVANRERAVEHKSRERRDAGSVFYTPALNLDDLVWTRTEPGPAFDLTSDEIIDFLVEVGKHLNPGTNEAVAEAVAGLSTSNQLGQRVIEHSFSQFETLFRRDLLRFELEQNLGKAADGWYEVTMPDGGTRSVRAFPPRLVHMLAGNSSVVAATTIARAALTKGVHLLKLPSNDLFSAPAILQTMAQVDPKHPVTRSFSAVYWKGGDRSVESVLFRPLFFDKLVAWGGDAALRHAKEYIGPGFELVSFDPKTSISVIGREAFDTSETLHDAATRAAIDASHYNQESCAASRIQFVEGTIEQVDDFCERLVGELAIDRPLSSAFGPVTPPDIRQEVEMLKMMPESFRVWGRYDGSGLVVRSARPVDWHPIAKTVNVVPVANAADAVRHTTVATQTIGVYPPHRTIELRDAFASAGGQRIVSLGSNGTSDATGLPHDGFYPIHRFMRWVYSTI
jgi:hypothetical protein